MILVSPHRTIRMKRTTLSLALIAILPILAHAQKNPGEAATIDGIQVKGDARPGAVVKVLVRVKLEKGFHVHSNKPSENNYIPTVITLEAPPGIKAGEIVYPKGKSLKVEGIEIPLSVYEGEFEIIVPLGLSAQAKLPAVIPAILRYQACQGAHCYPPQRLKLEIKLPGS